jgi:signal transduction histidine kinase
MIERILIVVGLLTSFVGIAETQAKECDAGICDLSSRNWQQSSTVSLDGDWEFYWSQHLTPAAIAAGEGELTGFLHPAHAWDPDTFETTSISSFGYATYRLRLRLQADQPLSLKFTPIASASKIWINGQLIAESGHIGTRASEEEAGQREVIHSFSPRSGVNEIVLQMSNFSYPFTNSKSIHIGLAENVYAETIEGLIRDSIIFGAILIMAFYHFYLWWLRRERIAPLYFGLFCLSVGLRSLVKGGGFVIQYLLPQAPFELHLKMEYLGMSVGLGSIVMLSRYLYPREFNRHLAYTVAGATGFWTLLILVTNASIFPILLRPYQLLTFVSGHFVLIAVLLAAFRRREGARLFLVGFGGFYLTSFNDLMVAVNLINNFYMAHFGVFTLILSQSLILSLRFNRAFDRAEQAEREVRSLNESLEHKVQERTEEITTILTHVKFGFLAVDSQGRILPGFTDSCHKLLQRQVNPGDTFLEVLTIDETTREHTATALVQVFDELMPPEVTLAQIPKRVQVADRSLSLSGAEIRDQDSGKIKSILFTINDVTSLQKAEQKIRYNEMLINILQEREAFALFVDDFYADLEAAHEALKRQDAGKVRLILHTLKGNLGAFGIYSIYQKVHELESLTEIGQENLATLRRAMGELIETNQQLLQLGHTVDDSYPVSGEDLESLSFYVEQNLQSSEKIWIRDKIKTFYYKPAQSFLGPLTIMGENIAERLGKEVRLEVIGAHRRVPGHFAPVLRNVIHIIRNAIDHGIENPDEREPKPATGSVRVELVEQEDCFEVTIADDGQGLDKERILSVALEHELVTAEDLPQLTDQEIYQLIFAADFSTAQEVSDISGRGIGMSAMRNAVDELGGTIKLTTRRGEGTTIAIRLPHKEAMAQRLNSEVA